MTLAQNTKKMQEVFLETPEGGRVPFSSLYAEGPALVLWTRNCA